jgi:hypothetical protein
VSSTPSINEIDEMLTERVAARVAAGPMWPMQAEPAWRDGDTYLRRRRGDKLVTLGPDLFTNLAEMAAIRPPLPELLPPEIAERVAVFDQLLDFADAEPYQAVERSGRAARCASRD